ncbi:MAG: hypothetical protein ABIJ39_06580 [Chloroflexota bacterium]
MTIVELAENVMNVVDFDPEFTNLSSGTYLVYHDQPLIAEYISIDGTRRGNILEYYPYYHDEIKMIQPEGRELLLMNYEGSWQYTIRKIDLVDQTMRSWRVTFEDPDVLLCSEWINGRSSDSYCKDLVSFSPDGRWMVVDGRIHDRYGWYVIDFENGRAGYIYSTPWIYRYEGVPTYEQESPRHYTWSAGSNVLFRVLYDRQVDSIDWRYCMLVPAELRLVCGEMTEDKLFGVSPDGLRVVIWHLESGDGEGEITDTLIVGSPECILGLDLCQEDIVIRLPQRGSSISYWTITVIADDDDYLIWAKYIVNQQAEPGIVGRVNWETGESEILFTNLPVGFSIFTLSPSGEWLGGTDNFGGSVLIRMDPGIIRRFEIGYFDGWLVIP